MAVWPQEPMEPDFQQTPKLGDVPSGAWGRSLERTDLSSHMPKYMNTRNDHFDGSCRREDNAGLRHPPRSACPEDSCPSA